MSSQHDLTVFHKASCPGQVTVEEGPCLGSLSCCSINPSPQVNPKGGACLWRMARCLSSIRVESENILILESVGLKHCGFIFCPVCLLTYTRLPLTLICQWGSSVNGPSFILYSEILVFLRPPHVDKWFRTCSSSSETQQARLLLTDVCLWCLVSKFCICYKSDLFLSLWSQLDVMITLVLPDRALDSTDSSLWQIFTPARLDPAVLGSGSSLCPGWSGSFDTELPRFISMFVSVAFMHISKLVLVVLFQFWFCGLKFRTSDPVTFCSVQLTHEAWCRNPVQSLTMATRGTSCDLSLNGWISVSDVWLTARLICSAIISILRSL